MTSPSLFPSPDPYRRRRCAKLYNKLNKLNIVFVCLFGCLVGRLFGGDAVESEKAIKHRTWCLSICQFVLLSKDKNCVQSWLSGYCRDLRQETMEKIIENVNWKHAKLTRKGGIGAIGGRATHPSGGSIHLLFHSLQRTVPETPEHIAAAASTGCSMHRWHTPVKEQRSCSSCNLQHNTWHSRVTCQNCRSLRTLDSKLGVLASLFLKTIRKTKSVNESSARLGWNHVGIATTKWPITRARRCTASNLDLSLLSLQITTKHNWNTTRGLSRENEVKAAKFNHDYEEAAVLVRERANRAVQKVPNECCPELPPAQESQSGRFSRQNSSHFSGERTIACFD